MHACVFIRDISVIRGSHFLSSLVAALRRVIRDIVSSFWALDRIAAEVITQSSRPRSQS